ncbi:MAG: site-2 protease family protein [Fimbriimonadales bacterium]
MSFEAPEPPPIYAPKPPPIYDPGPPPQQPKTKPKGIWGAILTGLIVIGKFLGAIGKVLLPILKFGKIGKLLLTGGSMLLSVLVYAQIFGWKFAVGFVLCILVHEMGHVFMAWRQGLPVSAPIFIPYFGALIMLKQMPRTAWIDAVVGIGGPLFGTLAGLACWGLFSATGNYLFLGLAFVAFFMNLFNLTPMYPLDGGRIVGAISHWLWIAGLLMMIGLYVFDIVHNPFIWILIILSVPQIWVRFKNKGGTPQPATGEQRVIMGAAYIGLASFLFWAMTATHVDIEQRVRAGRNAPIASRGTSRHSGLL